MVQCTTVRKQWRLLIRLFLVLWPPLSRFSGSKVGDTIRRCPVLAPRRQATTDGNRGRATRHLISCHLRRRDGYERRWRRDIPRLLTPATSDYGRVTADRSAWFWGEPDKTRFDSSSYTMFFRRKQGVIPAISAAHDSIGHA